MRLNRGERLDIYGTIAFYGAIEGENALPRSVLSKETGSTILRAALTELRVHDAVNTLLPAAAANDDLGLIGGTYGTTAPTVQSRDSKAASLTGYARWRTPPLPASYVAGTSLTIVVTAKTSTVADTSATLDAQAFEDDGLGGCGSDLVSTGAQSVNSATETEYSFTVTGTGLVPGDVLDVRLTVAIVDSATGTAVVTTISKIEVTSTVQG